MKFKMNNKIWEILQLPREEFYQVREEISIEDRKEFPKTTCLFGFADLMKHKIYLNDSLCKDELRTTLIHELVHSYLWSYGCSYTEYTEDAVCDTVSASFYIIHKIVEDYFDKK